jgi:hypothetical protein
VRQKKHPEEKHPVEFNYPPVRQKNIPLNLIILLRQKNISLDLIIGL